MWQTTDRTRAVASQHDVAALKASLALALTRQIGCLFGDEEDPWSLDAVAKHSGRFALALDAALRYAKQVDVRADIEEDTWEDYAWWTIDGFMFTYSEYYNEQSEEWWSNPAFRIAGLGSALEDVSSELHGTAHAQWLVEQGVPELRAALAEVLHISPAEVMERAP